eukprot:12889901-Prorocentrum_lima.AAC.1
MLCKALQKIHDKQGQALMNLSEVHTFHSIGMKVRHWDRDPVCPNRAISTDKPNTPFKAVVLDHDLPKVSME